MQIPPRERLHDVPQVNYFEYFYRTTNSDLDLRTDLPASEPDALIRARIRNAGLLLDLENCDAGYSPTYWQRDRLPSEFHSKVSVIFDGIDTSVWRPLDRPARIVGGKSIPDDMKVVTYVSRGMESMRGFDIFMKVAKRICDARQDVIFLVASEDRVAYGGDTRMTGGKSFREWVLSQDDYDLDRIIFLGRIPPLELVTLFNLSNLHLYWTVPFVPSWSVFNAMACGTVILASDTEPVREVVHHEENGLRTDFFDVDEWVAQIGQVMDNPANYSELGQNARETVQTYHSMDVCMPQITRLYDRTA